MQDNGTPPMVGPTRRDPWNKGKPIGAKPPLRPSHVWTIGALFNLAIDSKLRGCDV
jgi:hypothetical protein